jgi:hypothetical protein
MRTLAAIGSGFTSTVVDRPVLDENDQTSAIIASIEAHNEVMELCSEADRYSDLATGLENLANVVASIESATVSEMGLVDIAGDIAMAGSGHAGDVLTPGLESAEGTTISVEGIKSIAQDIWKAIKEFVKKVWKSVETFFHKIFGALPRLRKSLIALKERADSYMDKSIDEGKTEIGSGINPLVRNNAAPSTSKQVEDTLEISKEVVNGLFDTYTKAIIVRGETIKSGLKDYKPDSKWDADKHSAALTKVFAWKNDGSEMKNAFSATKFNSADRRFSDDLDVCAIPMAGNMSVFVQTPKAIKTSALGIAEFHRGRCIRVMATFERSQDAIDSHEVDTFTVANIKSIADKCIDIVDGIEAWERGKNIGKIKDLVKDIEKNGDALTKAEDKLEDVTSELRAYPKSASAFVKSFTQWGAEPHTTITSNALAAVRAAVSVCNKSLSNYK